MVTRKMTDTSIVAPTEDEVKKENFFAFFFPKI